MEVVDLTASYHGRPAVAGVNLKIEPRQVTALIGPSGSGKSTLLRCMNSMHLTVPGAGVTGSVLLDDVDIYTAKISPVEIRQRVGMVFQRPTPFPTMSIRDNVLAGLHLGRRLGRGSHDDLVEQALVRAGLWHEVKDRLKAPGGRLSGGQQQRLCIARALAVEPEILLMDEPCSALDPSATLTVEDLIKEIKQTYTVVIVTHNLQQAARVADTTAFLTVPAAGEPGRLVEVGPTERIFSTPRQQATEDYITGKAG
ncbi:phosphate ABC transporter ATP-binding protein [Kitasatospora sp. GP82]|uniref:phosphate ABC transporter ATP-binding protein n=1 Tax=Kitasatospora sp. GP82 TaxID=3035089 RepID=UPI002474DC5F|nr:phosphate ABC transporter ATP-binding protein [Kitasatospora sp. GP82]